MDEAEKRLHGRLPLLQLLHVLREGTLGGLRVGDAIDRIEATLGPPQAPAVRSGRRSKLYSWLYGNATILSAGGRVEGIQLDFEGNRPALVEAGAMRQWTLEDWRAFAERERWTLRERGPVIQLVGHHGVIALDPHGTLHVVDLRRSPTVSTATHLTPPSLIHPDRSNDPLPSLTTPLGNRNHPRLPSPRVHSVCEIANSTDRIKTRHSSRFSRVSARHHQMWSVRLPMTFGCGLPASASVSETTALVPALRPQPRRGAV